MSAPMSVSVRYFAILREQRGIAEEILPAQGLTPLTLYLSLAARYGFTLPSDRLGVAVNDAFCSMDVLLKNGDQVAFIPPVAGG